MRLFGACQQLDFTGVYTLSVPRATTTPAPVFVSEGLPHPIAAMVTNGAIIGPVRKMIFGVGLTNELQDATPETASVVIGRALSEQAGKSLDAVVFDTTAASATRPAGLLNSVTPIGATAGGGLAALAADIANIADAIATAGANPDNMWFFAAAKEAVKLRLLASPTFNYPIVSTPVTAGTVVGIDPAAIATGFSGVPAIVDGSSVVAPGTRSLWQTDTMVLRVRNNCAWGPLITGAVQVVNSVTW